MALIDDDFSDEGDELLSQAVSVADHADPDETLAPLTNSTMKVLEKFVDLDLEKSTSSVEDIFEGDIELDKDPDYVPEAEQEPAPTTSKENYYLNQQQSVHPRQQPLNQQNQVEGQKSLFGHIMFLMTRKLMVILLRLLFAKSRLVGLSVQRGYCRQDQQHLD